VPRHASLAVPDNDGSRNEVHLRTVVLAICRWPNRALPHHQAVRDLVDHERPLQLRLISRRPALLDRHTAFPAKQGSTYEVTEQARYA
jgi:hypothetical protein